MQAFLDDIIGQIKESQVKLGYSEETVRLFYRLDGLQSRLGEQVDSIRQAAHTLSQMPELQQTALGPLSFRATKGRLEVTVSPEGVRYVHQEVPTPPFLVDIVNLFGPCGHATLGQVQDLFARYGEFILEEAPGSADFDFVIRFADPNIDPYWYCFKDEGGILTYHRLSPKDYQVRI